MFNRQIPTQKLRPVDNAILKQYCKFSNRSNLAGLDYLERNDPWEDYGIGYFMDFANSDHVTIWRAAIRYRWSWTAFYSRVCEDWTVVSCQPDDPLVQQWQIIQSSFSSSRFSAVPDLRIYDGDVYYVIVEQVSYPKSWIRNRESLDQLCFSFQNAVDQRMSVEDCSI